MNCAICVGSGKNLRNFTESFLGVPLFKLITDVSGIDVSHFGEYFVCIECALSLYQAHILRKKIRKVLKNKDESVEVSSNIKDQTVNGFEAQVALKFSEEPIAANKKSQSKHGSHLAKQENLKSKNQKLQKTDKSSILCSQDVFGENKVKKRKGKPAETKSCPNCGGVFRSHTFDMHFFSEKCSTSVFPCQEPSCKKKFSNIKIMRYHMGKCHPLSIYTLNDAK